MKHKGTAAFLRLRRDDLAALRRQDAGRPHGCSQRLHRLFEPGREILVAHHAARG